MASECRGMFYTAFSGLKGPIEDMAAEGDRAVMRVTLSRTHTGEFLGVPASGNSVKFQGYFTLRIAGGKVVEEWGLMDLMGLMQQIGAVRAG